MAPGLLQRAQGLSVTMETLAALGAMLSLRRSGRATDPRIAALLEDAVASIDPALLSTTTAHEEAVTLGFIRAFFAQATELLDHPDRAPGWTHTDPAILSFYGNASRQVVTAIGQMAQEHTWLAALLGSGGGRFLDIGTGVGMIAIEAAKAWQGWTVTGIDVFEPPLLLARRNVEEAGLGDRIELRLQGVEALPNDDRYDLVWFPGPFIPEPLVAPALAQLRQMINPGGALIFGFFGAPNPAAQVLTDLRTVRNGGHAWRVEGVTAALQAAGFRNVTGYALGTLTSLVSGRT
jgi:SAM-dependent methyltransferase